MSGKEFDVIAVGLQCIDIVSSPVPADALGRDLSLVRHTELQLGGDALNQAVTLSRLGARVGLMGLTGNDRMGDILIGQLKGYPGLTVLNRRADVNTSISLVLVDEAGERHFVYQPESNVAFRFEHIDQEAVKRTDFLSVGGCLSLPGLEGEGLIRLFSLAKAAGARTAVDFSVSGYEWDHDALREALRLTDYALPSELEACRLTGDEGDIPRMARGVRDLGAANCVIKLGSRGCYVDADGYAGYVPAYPCRCVDTTGAGDAFAAAFLYARTRNWDILRCARFANAAGSIAVERTGANAAIQSAAQVEARMAGEDRAAEPGGE